MKGRPPGVSGPASRAPANTLTPGAQAPAAGGVWLRVAGVVGFALATAVGARIAIPLPTTPVPITLQTLFVLLTGISLGPRLGTLSMAFYLLLGTTGYHVFAGANWGLQTICGPTGGYLLGFIIAQPIIGRLSRAEHNTWAGLPAAVLAGNAIIFACGLSWLALWSGAGWQQTLQWGLWPFLPGLFVKALLVLGLGRPALLRVRPVFEPRPVGRH